MREYFKSDIVRLSKPLESVKQCCVYFLINDSDIVYVGFSTDLNYRLRSHKKDKIFNRVYDIKVEDIKSGLILEKYYIQKFKPAYNLAYNDENMLKQKQKRKEICVVTRPTIEEIKIHIKDSNRIFKESQPDRPIKDIIPKFENVELIETKYNLIKNTYCKKLIDNKYFYVINYNGVFYKSKFNNCSIVTIENKEYKLSGIYGELK